MTPFISDLARFEQGELTSDEEANLFQFLIDEDLLYGLQGYYGRHAEQLVAAGLCHWKGTT